MGAKLNCHKAAIFSDIHSNYHAFRACFEDALARGADCFIFLGDYVSDLADPRETMDLVYEIRARYPTVCLRGNRERYLLERARGETSFQPGSKTGSLLYTYSQLNGQDLAFFESLLVCDRIKLNGIPFEIAHAFREDDRFYFEKADERIGEVFGQMETAYLLTGHSHKQYIRQWDGKTILNPGSIGVPRGYGHLTQYAMLEFEHGTVKPVLYQLPYDLRSMVRRQFESGLAELAPHWAVSLIYDVITGEEYTVELLARVLEQAEGDETAVHDEALWHYIAEDMGMRFTEPEILEHFNL